jgi:hypothetical protein
MLSITYAHLTLVDILLIYAGTPNFILIIQHQWCYQNFRDMCGWASIPFCSQASPTLYLSTSQMQVRIVLTTL